MTVHLNSREAFESVKPELSRRQAEVLDAIAALHREGRDGCDQDIALRLGLPINQVTPRRGELATAGLILPSVRRRGPRGRMVQTWRPKPEQMRLFDFFAGSTR